MTKLSKRTIKRIVRRIKKIIDVHAYFRADDSGYYYGEIYADYRDEFDEGTIIDIFKAENPRDKFYELLDFFDYECECRSEFVKTIKNHFNEDSKTLDFNKHENFIHEWVDENIYYTYPYDHYLNQDVCINIIVDCGDGNYDYTKNELFGCNFSEKGLEGREESSLVWLMRQQGYEMEAITEFVENENTQGSKLFESIYQECRNTSTCMNALAFFVKLSLREAIDLHEFVNNIRFTEKGYEKISDEQDGEIILDKATACGLYDTWNGAGSMLEIQLEKDVVLPVKYIDSALPDGCRGYSISSIYGIISSFWSDGGLTINAQEKVA